MRIIAPLALLVAATQLVGTALAYPDGAPWGVAIQAGEQNCASCHFGNDPVDESPSLSLHGLPVTPVADEVYQLTIRFDDPDIVVAGFQLIAQGEGEQAGSFDSPAANVEYIGGAIRSTAPVKETDIATWIVAWRAPRELSATITFYLAATAANDDQSPFGDTVHYRTYSLKTKP